MEPNSRRDELILDFALRYEWPEAEVRDFLRRGLLTIKDIEEAVQVMPPPELERELLRLAESVKFWA